MNQSLLFLLIFWFFLIYSVAGTTYHIVMEVRRLLRERNQFKASLALAEEYAQDLEEEKAELEAGYSAMALQIETHATLIQTLVAHTEEHCAQIAELGSMGALRLQIIRAPLEDGEQGEEPYAESECPTLPELDPAWFEVEELDNL